HLSTEAALLYTHLPAIQGDGFAEGLAEAACFYAWHGFSASPWEDSARLISTVRHPQMTGCSLRSGGLPLSGRAAQWWRAPSAILRREISAVRPAATNCVHPH